MGSPRPFQDLLKDYENDPSKWKIVRSESTPSTNIRNKGGTSLQEVLQHEDTGEEIVRHTLLKPDGSVFAPAHFRPSWK